MDNFTRKCLFVWNGLFSLTCGWHYILDIYGSYIRLGHVWTSSNDAWRDGKPIAVSSDNVIRVA